MTTNRISASRTDPDHVWHWAPDRNEIWVSGPVVALPLFTALLYLAIPVDFVIVSPTASRLIYLSSAATLLLAVGLAIRSAGSRSSWTVLGLVFIAVAPFVSVGSESAIGGLYVCTPIIVGILIAKVCTPKRLAIFSAIASLVLISEAMTRLHWYTSQVGLYRFASYVVADFRSRGFIGQPVPSAFIAVAIAAPCAMYFARQRRWPWMLVSIAALVGALATTGTRSALLLTAVVGIIWIFQMREYIARRLLFAVFAAIAGISAIIAIFSVGGWSSTARLFRFSDLAESESGLVRSNALSSLMQLPNPCGTSCTLLGHGGRQFENELMSTPSYFGLSTVDNQFVTIFWDFGVVGLAALVAALCWSVRVGFSRQYGLPAKVGASITAIIISSGLFYDAIYVRPSGMVLGIGIGLMILYSKSGSSEYGSLSGGLPSDR